MSGGGVDGGGEKGGLPSGRVPRPLHRVLLLRTDGPGEGDSFENTGKNKFKIERKVVTRIVTHLRAKEILRSRGFPVIPSFPVGSADEALLRAGEVGYPVVLKVDSEKVVHKTEAGAVVTGIEGPGELEEAFSSLRALLSWADPEGRITLEKMVPPGVELFAGCVDDPSYGKVIAFGVGGVFLELYGDVTHRLAPITERDAFEMVEELRGKSLLEGFRGLPPVDRKALVGFFLRFSEFALQEDFREVDVNPLICRGEEIFIVDARFVRG
ncbi:MAG: acetyl-CoA synthetase [Deltaproteobacteria bacterium]|nr:MAG: acetyl-CoA synthetase [Deltaproteobacteria bacterium]